MAENKRVVAIIPAAGAGNRLRSVIDHPKQFLHVAGKPILAHTLLVFEELSIIDEIVVVAPANALHQVEDEVVSPFSISKVHKVIAGGNTRQDSVEKGIDAVRAYPPEIVVVHDGVRPFVTRDMIRESVDSAREFGGCVVGIPAVDTIKTVRERRIEATIDRSVLWYAQTPQTFRYELIREAYEKANRDKFVGTDEAMLLEHLGVKVSMVEGSLLNFKITTPEHLVFAEALFNCATARGDQ